ncbi:hypothetical protein trd_A0540 (plasmid) [Thermomicrobium roseum DSM 5159]|uniref:Uncharacterized protein n=1 Tax=Thermomicrobium roseum (strain ATCC 27502 / DSM 5159 / P-2) TaxID=309801 RepID=B9L426_THERP|nr:hypothetical protein trd_A0540 [Thermomicrobium roseum DSM 5159]
MERGVATPLSATRTGEPAIRSRHLQAIRSTVSVLTELPNG